MILLRLISWPYIRKHVLRTVVTTIGIVLGVALLVSMRTANQSVLRGFRQTVDRISGKAQLQVSAGDVGIPEDVLEKVQSVPQVRAAAPVIEATVDTGMAGQGRILFLAVDMTGDRELRDYDLDTNNSGDDAIDDPLVFLAQPDSIILTREFVDRNGLRLGSVIAFDTMQGRKRLTVRGILKAGGLATAFGGNLGIMDIYAAQMVFGRGRHFDRIDIGLRDGVSLEQGVAALRQALGGGFTVEPPSGRGQQFESLLGIFTSAMNISSLFALFIGMFLIYNSFAIAVTQRRGEIGILRALGATRRQIRGLFLAESAIAGLAGSAVGVGVGLAFSRSLAGSTGSLMESMFGVPPSPGDVLVDPRFLFVALTLGIVTSMLAALLPARNAARVEPIQALQKGKYQVLSAGENRARRIAGLVALILALAMLPLANRVALYAGYLFTVLAFLLFTPFLSLELARFLRRPLRWLRPVEGSLAADGLIQAPRRTSATVAALMLSLALVVAQGGISRASYAGIETWIAGTLNPDLFVVTSETVASRDFHFPAAMQADIERIPGVEEVQSVREPRVQFRGRPLQVVAIDLAAFGRRVHRITVAGNLATMNRLASEGNGVIATESLTGLNGLHLGDTIELPTPAGPWRLPIVGIVRDYSSQQGSVYLDRKAYIRYFQDDTVDIFRVYVKRGVSPEEVRRRIVGALSGQRRIFVMLNREVRDYIMKVVTQWLGMTYLQIVVAIVVAILGIVNTLTVSIADRRRELGVLRALGGLRSQIRGTIWMEAVSVGFIGLVLGVAAGGIFLYYELNAIEHEFTGMPLPFTLPLGIIALLVPVILGAAFVSALVPAETAVRASLVEALEYE